MTVYNEAMNEDIVGTKTPARFDENKNDWMMDSVVHYKNGSNESTEVSEANPLPTKDEDALSELEDMKAELLAIKTELENLESKDFATDAKLDSIIAAIGALNDKIDDIQDGTDPAVVEVSGSTVKVIKEYLATVELMTFANFYYGEIKSAFGGDSRALDVSKYQKNAILVQNRHDIAVTVTITLYHKANVLGSPGSMGSVVTTDSVAAGARKVYRAKEYPELNDPMIGIRLFIARASAPASGDIDVVFLGGAV